MQNSSSYSAILLHDARLKDLNEINYFDALGNRKTTQDNIEKIEKREEGEIVLLKSGIEIPIEHIHSVDGDISPFYGDDFYKCDCV